MKRYMCVLLAVLTLFSASAGAESALDSAEKFLGDAWDSVSGAAEDALDSAGAAIGQVWSDVRGAAFDAWNDAGTFLSEKRDEISVWMSVSGSDALEKLKAVYDEETAKMRLDGAQANAFWLEILDYAQAREIAKVTQAKLTLAALACIQAQGEAEDALQAAREMLTNGGIEDQASAEAALAAMLDADVRQPNPDEPRYYMGALVNAGKDNGYSGAKAIESGDPHFGWKLGDFFVSGYTSVYEDADGNPVFIKTLGDQIELWFQLEQDIDCLNGKDALSISEDANGFDERFGISKTNFGRGALVTQHTDYRNAAGAPQLYTDYLSGIVASGADTTVQLFEEGDYAVALNYEIKDESPAIGSSYHNYRIAFKFSVRNGNCMAYPFDVATGAELTNAAVTENGFYLDLARSRYLDINIKREVLAEGAIGLTEDVRFNRPARDGDRYTEEGVYTITVSNRYTGQQTVKQIYVGTNRILTAHMVTGLSVEEIRKQLARGAQIAEDGTIIGTAND